MNTNNTSLDFVIEEPPAPRSGRPGGSGEWADLLRRLLAEAPYTWVRVGKTYVNTGATMPAKSASKSTGIKVETALRTLPERTAEGKNQYALYVRVIPS